MAATYEPIATTTLGSAASSITFSSIPSTYTDLRLVLVPTAGSGTGVAQIQFNSDTGANYSRTWITGNGTAASSSSNTGSSYIALNTTAFNNSYPMMSITDIFSYAGSTYKTVLSSNNQDYNGSGATNAVVGLWRSTSAITRIDIIHSKSGLGESYATGTTATLYGIKAA